MRFRLGQQNLLGKWLFIAVVLCLVISLKVCANDGGESGKMFFKPDSQQARIINFGQIKLEVPAGAAEQEMTVEMVEPDLTGISIPRGFRVVSKVYRFGPSGMKFGKGKELDLKINLEEKNKGARLYYINRNTKQLEQVENQELKRETGRLNVKIRHFSDYVLGINAGWDGSGLNPFSDYITNGIETVNVCGHYMPQIRLKVYSVKGRGMDLDFTIASEPIPNKVLDRNTTFFGLGSIAPGLKLDLPFLRKDYYVEYDTSSENYYVALGGEARINIPGKDAYFVSPKIPATSSGTGTLSGWNVYNYNSNSFAVNRNSLGVYKEAYLSDGRRIQDYDTYQTVTDLNGNMIKYTYHTMKFGNTVCEGCDYVSYNFEKKLIDSIEDTMGRMFYFAYNNTGDLTQIKQKLSDKSIKTILTLNYSETQIIITDAVGRVYKLNYNLKTNDPYLSYYSETLSRRLLGVNYPNGVSSNYQYKLIGETNYITSQKWYKQGQSTAFREVKYENQYSIYIPGSYVYVTDGITKKAYTFSDNGSMLTESVYSIASGNLLKNVANQYSKIFSHTTTDGETYGSELLTSATTTIYKSSDSSPGEAQTWKYEYDNWGNITKVTDPQGTETVMAFANTNCNQNLSKLAGLTGTETGPETKIKTKTVSKSELSNELTSLRANGAEIIGYTKVPFTSKYAIAYKITIISTHTVYYVFQDPLYTTGAAWNQMISKATLVTDAVHGTTKLKQTHYQYDTITGDLKQESEVYNSGYLNTYYTYDSYGNVLTKTDANGNKLSFEYADTNENPFKSAYLTKVVAADGTTVATYDYNIDTGNKTTATDPKGNIYHYEYDDIGRLTKEYLEDNDSNIEITRILDYDDTKNMLTMLYGNDSVKYQAGRICYDPLFGKPTELQRYNDLVTGLSGLGSDWITQKKYTYDSNGRMVTETDALDDTTTYTYDALGRKTLITERYGTITTKFAYDDRTVTTTDGNGNIKKDTYDLLDRLVTVAEYPTPTSTPYTTDYVYDTYYDNFGDKPVYHLLTTTNSLKAVTTNTYDNLGRLIRIDYPQDGSNPMAAETYTYDNVGNLKTKTNGKGTKTLDYEYFAGYRLQQVTEPDGRKVSYTYDANDNPLTQTWDTGSYTYDYDARNRVQQLTAKLDGNNFNVGYAYDTFGRVTGITYPGRSEQVTYTYDTLDRLQTIPGFVSGCTYDKNNKLLTMSLGNGLINEYIYDYKGRPIFISSASHEILVNLNYDYDNVGNIVELNQDLYEYDGMNRLVWAGNIAKASVVSTPYGQGTAWSYDGAGNRTGEQSYSSGTLQSNITLGYDLANRLWSKGNVTYLNDAAGCRTAKYEADATWTYHYDSESRLTSVVKGSTTIAASTYDGAGMRVKKVNDGKTIYSVYSGSNPLLEYNATTDKYTYYIYAGKQSVAEEKDGVKSFYHRDHLGSIRAITDERKRISGLFNYDAWGNFKSSGEYGENITNGDMELSTTSINPDVLDKCEETVSIYKWDRVNDEKSNVYIDDGIGYIQVQDMGRTCYYETNTGINNSRCIAIRRIAERPDLINSYYANKDLYVSPDTDYLLTGYYKSGNTSSTSANAQLVYYDSGGNIITTHETGSLGYSSGWKQFTLSSHAPANAAKLEIRLTQGTTLGTTIYFDSIKLKVSGLTAEAEYTGKKEDAGTGLKYFGARFYDPEVGRFIAQDPAKDGGNWFAYCDDNPMNNYDPNGRETRTVTFSETIPGRAMTAAGEGNFAFTTTGAYDVKVGGTLQVDTKPNGDITVSVTVGASLDSHLPDELGIEVTANVGGRVSAWDDNGGKGFGHSVGQAFTTPTISTRSNPGGFYDKSYTREFGFNSKQSILDLTPHIISITLTLDIYTYASDGCAATRTGSTQVTKQVEVNESGGADSSDPSTNIDYSSFIFDDF